MPPSQRAQAVSGADIVAYARNFLGDPYVWGAEGPNAFDCSGLVDYVYKRFGLAVPRTTGDMMASKGGLQPITEQQLQPGDLILSKGWVSGEPNQGHVGIYAGSGKLIEAGDPVQVSTFGPNYKAHVTGYRRVPGVTGFGAPTPGGTGNTGGYTGGLPNPTDPSQVAGFLSQNWIASPQSVTQGLTNIGTGILGIAQAGASVGSLAGTLSRALLPSNLLRGALMFAGLIAVVIGIWFIASEAKDT